jgi:rare lipoprotein A
MVVRLGAAICLVVAMSGYSSSALANSGGASVEPDAREITAKEGAAPDEAERGDPVRGVASTYNPFKPGWREGGPETASGERYDAAAWTAAIKTTLRHKFGGVRYGKSYRPAYALVEGEGKQVIVKINDVGPLVPGRVIDLNERTMRHFDPSLQRGLIQSVKVTPLLGTSWTPGPVRSADRSRVAEDQGRRSGGPA